MEGLITSRLAPKASVESFCSAISHTDSLMRGSSSKLRMPASSPLESSTQEQLDQQHPQIPGLQLFGVDEFLEQNQHLLSPPSTDTAQTTTTSDATVPVREGAAKAAQNISRLNELCQSKGIKPEYKYVVVAAVGGGPGRFSGTLTLGTHVFRLPAPELSKKDVKQVLAELGLATAEAMPAASADVPAPPAGNWVGKLQEFYGALPPGVMPPQYTLFTHTPGTYAYEVSLPAHASTPFGSRHHPWPSKKAAKVAAAHAAVTHLVSLGLIGPDGEYVNPPTSGTAFDHLDATSASTSTPKKILTPAEPGSTSALNSPSANSVQQAETLARELGFCTPTYHFEADDRASNLWSGGATFKDEPLLPGVVGEVRHVVGKKKAKAESAQEVCSRLEAMKKRRVERFK